MLIANIFIFIICVMIYVYIGLSLVEPIKNETLYIYFWVAYIFFGITITNVILISKYWGKIATKIGPPGPRGARGDDGEQGPDGVCTSDTNIVYAQKYIKEAITDTILSYYNDIARDDILDEKTLKLKNNYLDYKIKLMITSKQFETVLLVPSDDNNPDKKPTEYKIYGKTIEDLSGYLSGIWREWITGIIQADPDNARTLFITFDAQIDISPKIEEYFNTEVMKYDVWYWGSTRVFRPLEAEICRSKYVLEDGRVIPNTRYPMNNRSKLEILEYEFTDISIKTDNRFELLAVLDIGDVRRWQEYDRDFAKKYDYISKYSSTAFYIPKAFTLKAGRKYYPVGCVAVNNGDDASDVKRKTIVVSGDIVIPNSYDVIMKNNLLIRDTQNDKIKYSRKRGSKKTKRYEKNFVTNTKYEIYLNRNIIENNNRYQINSREDRVKLSSPRRDCISFVRFYTNEKEYSTIGDIPFTIASKNDVPTKYRIFNNPNKYEGIVAVPKKCLLEVPEISEFWSFRWNTIINKNYYKDFGHKPIPKPAWIGSGRHSKGTKNFKIGPSTLKRRVIKSRKFDIQEDDKGFELIRIRHPNDPEPKHYKFKKYCFSPTIYPIKEFDKKYNDLGFGWFGYPLKKYRKYSIFAYLGLMPEGIVVHRFSGRKFYIKHYGGVEPNKFIVYIWNEDKLDFKDAITVKNSKTAFIGTAKKTDPRCQFKVVLDETNTNLFRLEPLEYPNTYLKLTFTVNENANLIKNPNNTRDQSLKNKRPIGINLDHTEMYVSLSSIKGDLSNKNPVIFFNQPATGTNMQIVEEKMPRNIDRGGSTEEQYKQEQILNRTDRNSFNYLYKDNLAHELLDETYPESKLNYRK